jgi:hypothetical protein
LRVKGIAVVVKSFETNVAEGITWNPFSVADLKMGSWIHSAM